MTVLFQSISFDWMVIPNNGSPSIAQGTGTLNGSAPGYKFRVWLYSGGSKVQIQIFTGTRRSRDRRMLPQTTYYDSGVVTLSTFGCQAVN